MFKRSQFIFLFASYILAGIATAQTSAPSKSDALPEPGSELSDSTAKNLVMSEENLKRTDEELKMMEEKLLSQLGESPEDKGSLAQVKEVPQKPQPKANAQPRIDSAAKVKPKATAAPLITSLELSPDLTLKKLEDHPAISKKSSPPRSPPPPMQQEVDDRLLNNDGRPVDLEQKLLIAESQVKILSRELEITRNSLASAERRIDDLSAFARVDSKPVEQAAPPPVAELPKEDDFNVAAAAPKPVTKQVVVKPSLPLMPKAPDSESAFKENDQQYVATVGVDRAPLRIGPSSRESTLFLVPAHTQVLIDTRVGQWYRVSTPDGTRGWIYGNSLLFDIPTDRDSTIRVHAYNVKYVSTGMAY